MGSGERVTAAEPIGLVLERSAGLYETWGRQIREDPRLAAAIESYRAVLVESRAVMERSAMVGICAACARVTTGGCCFKQVEEWYDPVLLLINRLLGAVLPNRREVPDNCLFLGNRGCRLPARFHFCINYLCDRLKMEIPELLMAEVRRTSGREIQAGAVLEFSLRRWLRAREVDPDSGWSLC